MGFGQYHHETTHYQQVRGAHKATGYPVPREDVKVGRMTNDEIMAEVGRNGIERTKRTAHNEVTRWLTDGTVIVRFRETDIFKLFPDGTIFVNTGGWNTISTRRHLMDAFSRHDFPATIWGDKKAGGNLLRDLRGDVEREVKFREYVTIFPDGSWQADLPAGY